ncbi:MAG: DUF502 domain-containing protein [Campylobacterales bacterium]
MTDKPSLPKRLILLALQGILTVFPLAVTIYVIYWIVSSLEAWVGSLLDMALPEVFYFPGMGLLVGIAILLGVGWLVNAYFIRNIVSFTEGVLERIPLVKTIYTGLRDLVGFVNIAKKQPEGSVVLVQMEDKSVIGFITDRHAGKTLGIEDENLVGVYLPLGYMIGGYTVYIDKSKLKYLSLGAEEAMRLVLTGGMATGPGRKGGKGQSL